MNKLAERDRKIRQLQNHMGELNKLIKHNSTEIDDKEKTNKYLSGVKRNFREYNNSMNEIKNQQIASLKILKKYLLSLKNNSELEENEIENIQSDINDIDSELNKISRAK